MPQEVLNNRAENSSQPTRQRERPMKKFTQPVARNGSCPRSANTPHFRSRRHRITAAQYRLDC